MAGTGQLYSHFQYSLLTGAVNYTSDKLKVGLLSSAYVPNLYTHQHWSDVSGSEVSGSGYTAGGASVSGASVTVTSASVWSPVWAGFTAYNYGQIIAPNSYTGYVYRCVGAGTSGGSAPSFPTTEGLTVADGSVTWATAGNAVTVATSSIVQWSNLTVTASYAVLYDAQQSAASVQPLIALQTFAAPQSPVNVTFQLSPDPTLGWFCYSPPA